MTDALSKLTGSGEAPWCDFATCELVSVDGTATSAVSPSDVKRVLGSRVDVGDYCGSVRAVLELNDGRIVAWDAVRDVTGSSFHRDAYGGDGEVWFAASVEAMRGKFVAEDWQGMGLP